MENQIQLDKILQVGLIDYISSLNDLLILNYVLACPQVRDQLPHLKAIVQYKGKLSQDYENTYDVSAYIMALSAF